MFLLYSEYLSTHPWDFLLAAGVIIVALGVPIVVSLGLRIQERRSEEERPLPWLEVIARREEQEIPPAVSADGQQGSAPGAVRASTHHKARPS
ncbi:MAG TPA: hypothetical protein VFY79_10125 [Dehalococcoidia bacterium]|nr:hypothetical protein [Dehalococcoidia bacterium]